MDNTWTVCKHRGYDITVNHSGKFQAKVLSLRDYGTTVHCVSENTLQGAKDAIDAKIGADKRKPLSIPVTVVGLDEDGRSQAGKRGERVIDGTLLGLNAGCGKFRVKDKTTTYQFEANHYGRCRVILQDDPQRDDILAAFRELLAAEELRSKAQLKFDKAIKGRDITGGGYGVNSRNVIEKELEIVTQAEKIRASWKGGE